MGFLLKQKGDAIFGFLIRLEELAAMTAIRKMIPVTAIAESKVGTMTHTVPSTKIPPLVIIRGGIHLVKQKDGLSFLI